jgi:hypothetical protein
MAEQVEMDFGPPLPTLPQLRYWVYCSAAAHLGRKLHNSTMPTLYRAMG